MNKIEPGDIIEATFFNKKTILRCVENWGDQLLLVDDETHSQKIAPIIDCVLVEKRDPPPRLKCRRG